MTEALEVSDMYGGRGRSGRTRTLAIDGEAGPLDLCLALAAVLAVALILARPMLGPARPAAMGNGVALRIEAGDTLWSIAAAHRPQTVSTHDFVEAISTANRLSDGVLREGQAIVIPAMDGEAAPMASR